MKPTITTWSGEPYPILVEPDAINAGYTWRGIPGPVVDSLIASGLAVDARNTPLDVTQRDHPTFRRVG
jgi:hypothetical protein